MYKGDYKGRTGTELGLHPIQASQVATDEEKAKTLEILLSGQCTCDWRKRDGYALIRFSVCPKCAELSDYMYGILDRAKKGGA